MNANRLLLFVALFSVAGTVIADLPARAVTPVRHGIVTGPTPTPTPTPRPTSTVFGASSSTACSVATDRFFSQGAACTATYTSGDLTWNAGNSTITSIDCGQPTDTTCSATFTFYSNSGAATALTCQLPATNSTTTRCSSSGSVSVTNSNVVAMAVKDTASNCGAFAPDCTIFYTVP